MNMYLLVAFLLLVVMLFLILRPFLLGTAEPVTGLPVDLNDPGAKARSMAKVARVGRAPEAAAAVATAEVVEDASDAASEEQVAVVGDAAPAPASGDDIRAQVEAAIAARKAALQARPCTACEAKVEPGDAFCRACGTKVTA
jgi:hypothetical protein